jgi:sortase (surface protein transpeptidase)
MAGHVVGPNGEPAVFARLSNLKKGDELFVDDSKNQSAVFIVREVRKYTESEQHAEVFNGGEGTHLNIITCAGDWDANHQRYLERLVVFATAD